MSDGLTRAERRVWYGICVVGIVVGAFLGWVAIQALGWRLS